LFIDKRFACGLYYLKVIVEFIVRTGGFEPALSSKLVHKTTRSTNWAKATAPMKPSEFRKIFDTSFDPLFK
jgi:hypothetical protein